jgi:hypothetical protein
VTVRTNKRRTDATSETARRLARIVEQHGPYDGTIEETTGLMCRECGYLDPCPTQRMGTAGDPAGPWLGFGPELAEDDDSVGIEVDGRDLENADQGDLDGGEEVAAPAT